MTYFVYILHSPNYDKYYIGQTNNLEDRLKRHNEGYEN
ncbi:MAG: GIY-YIG nuclease family protein [Flavobacterium sp.]